VETRLVDHRLALAANAGFLFRAEEGEFERTRRLHDALYGAGASWALTDALALAAEAYGG
jgi:hypothetical protein